MTSGSQPPGAGGSGTLATLTFHVLKPSLRPIIIAVDPGTGGLSDPLGSPLSSTIGSATTLTIVAASGSIAPAAAGGSSGDAVLAAPDRPDFSVPSPAEASLSRPQASAEWNLIAASHTGAGASWASAWSAPSSIGAGLAIAVIAGALALYVLARLTGISVTPSPGAWRALSVAGAGALLVAVMIARPVMRARATNSVAVFKDPSSANLFLGDSPLTVQEQVSVVGSPGLGAFDLEVDYNASVLSVTVAEGPFLSSSGNPTTCRTDYPQPGPAPLLVLRRWRACRGTGGTGRHRHV